MTSSILYGSEKEGITITFLTDENEKLLSIKGYSMKLFGKEQPIEIVEPMASEFKNFVTKELAKKAKYKELIKAFLEVLGETIVITNEREYENAVWEFNKKTELDTQMVDLNN